VRQDFQDFTPSVHMKDIEGYRDAVRQDIGNFQTTQVPTQVSTGLFGPSGTPLTREQMVPKTTRVSGEIPIDEMLARKQRQGKTMQDVWNSKERRPADLEAAKATYMGARQEILDAAAANPQIPGTSTIGPAIQHESDLINWGEFALPEVIRQQGNIPLPSGVMYTGHMLGAFSGSPALGAVAGATRGVLGAPSLLSRTAIGMYPRGTPTWLGKSVSAFPRVNPYVRPAVVSEE
jgi:hypothetical protein